MKGKKIETTRELPNEHDLSGEYNLYYFDRDQKKLIEKYGDVTPLRHLFWDEKIPKASIHHLTYDLGQMKESEIGDRREFYDLCRTLMRPQQYLTKFYGESLRFMGYERSVGTALKYQIFLHVQSGGSWVYTDDNFSDRVAWDTLIYGKLWRQDVVGEHVIWLAKKGFLPRIYHLLSPRGLKTVENVLTWYWEYGGPENTMEERKKYITHFHEIPSMLYDERIAAR